MNTYTIAAAHKNHQPVLSLNQLHRFLYSPNTSGSGNGKSRTAAKVSKMIEYVTACGYTEGCDFFPVTNNDKGFKCFDKDDYAITLGLAEAICMHRRSERSWALCADIVAMRHQHQQTCECNLQKETNARIEQERREKAIITSKAYEEITRTNEELMMVVGAANRVLSNMSLLNDVLSDVRYGQLDYRPEEEVAELPEPEYMPTVLRTNADQIATPNMPIPVAINVEGVSAT